MTGTVPVSLESRRTHRHSFSPNKHPSLLPRWVSGPCVSTAYAKTLTLRSGCWTNLGADKTDGRMAIVSQTLFQLSRQKIEFCFLRPTALPWWVKHTHTHTHTVWSGEACSTSAAGPRGLRLHVCVAAIDLSLGALHDIIGICPGCNLWASLCKRWSWVSTLPCALLFTFPIVEKQSAGVKTRNYTGNKVMSHTHSES